MQRSSESVMAIKGDIEERDYLEAGRPTWLGEVFLHLTTMDLLSESKLEYLYNRNGKEPFFAFPSILCLTLTSHWEAFKV